jgi:hypothetical protein
MTEISEKSVDAAPVALENEVKPKRGRGRPKGSKNKPKDGSAAEKVEKVRENEFTLTNLIVNLLKENENGLKVSEIVHKALESGYKTHSKKENGFTHCVYQAIHKLSDNSQIVKDGKCYKLSA